MSHLTENQSKYINNLFKDDKYYTCCVNITFKNDLVKVNLLLPSVGLKNKDKFIMSIPEEGEENLYSKFLPKEWKPVFVIDYLIHFSSIIIKPMFIMEMRILQIIF